jgi:prepilin-type processing-associated H-X9-DG protein
MLPIPSMIIHSNPGVDAPQMTEALLEHIVVEDDDGEYVNKSGIEVRVTTSGSMTRAVFPQWCKDFVKNLPEGQGKGGEPVILFFDGHASRW